jgi:PAS domain S-box-containing protein
VVGEKDRDSLEFRLRCKDGQWKWVMGSGIMVNTDPGEKSRRMVGTLSDISERKRAEDLLRTTEERWKFALEGAGDGVWDWDAQRNTLSFSLRAGEILGLAAHELLQDYRQWRQRVHPGDEVLAQTNRQSIEQPDGNTSSVEMRVLCNDGRWKWLLSRGMVVSRDSQGQPLRMVGTLSDISQRKNAEESLRLTMIELEQRKQEAEHHAAAKTYFLNAASHDLRQPLYAAQLFIDSLAEESLPQQANKTLHNLRLAIEDMSEQLETLLDISRFDMGRMEPDWRELPLAPLLHELAISYGPLAQKVGVTLHIRDSAAWIRTDAVLLRRLLGNLIDNAIKFAVCGQILVCVRRSAQGIRIEVRDNGPGIAPEHRQRIFDEYFQIDNPARNPHVGLGLGLAIVQRISRLLDAPLSLRTRPGQGSVFAITVPEVSTADISTSLPETP